MERIDIFEKLLLEEGYKAKTADSYKDAIGAVLRGNPELESVDQLLQDIPYYIYAYEYGDKRMANYGHRTVSSALKKFKEYFCDYDFGFSVKFFDEEALTLEDYSLFRNELIKSLREALPKAEGRENELVKIDSVKPGCSEFFVVFGNISAVIGVIVPLVNTCLAFEKIIKGNLGEVGKLNPLQSNALRPIMYAFRLYMEKRHQEQIEFGFKMLKPKKQKPFLTREYVEQVIRELER